MGWALQPGQRFVKNRPIASRMRQGCPRGTAPLGACHFNGLVRPSNTDVTAPLPAAFAVGVAFSASIVVTAAAVAVGATHDPSWALLPLGLLTAGIAVWTSWVGAVATAWICWAMDSGFVIGREAQLNFSLPAQVAALVLVAVALIGRSVGRGVARRRTRPRLPVAHR